jgi:serpin B
VSDKTHGKINKIVDQLKPELVMLLLNAIYFKGTWTYEFDKNDTHDDQFTTYGGPPVSCKMMKQSGEFDYLATDKWQALNLPYGDGDFSMTLLLPNVGVNINEVIEELDQTGLENSIGPISVHNGTVEIPKVLLEYELTMNDVLSSLGMSVAFEPGSADFTGMDHNNGRQLFISSAKHKTFVEINEEGTEAAAVTSVEVGVTSIGGSGFSFHADRPFLFFIRENRSQTILFMGKIVNPN